MPNLETGARLSRSLLWRLQRAFYSHAGADAWASATVPHYITCNAFIADAYARVVFGWMRDCVAEGIDATQPIYVAELGAGSGRFAFLFLKKLLALLARSPLAKLRFTYVMTDYSEANLAAWRAHASFAPLVAAGRLDFARFDVERDQTLALTESGVTLSETVNPMAVLANYFFDSIPQDVFYVCQGKLYECLSTLTAPAAEPNLDDPTLLERVELTWEDRPARARYYEDPELDRLLAGHRQHVKRGAVKFPTGALACCRAFSRLSNNRWLLVSGDKGHIGADSLDDRARPDLVKHGSISLDVNYVTLGDFFRGRGGRVLSMDHAANSLTVAAMEMGGRSHVELDAAFTAAIEGFGPDDYFILRKAMESTEKSMTLADAMSLLRLGRDCPRLLRQLLPTLRKRAPKAGESARRELRRLVERSWELYFHIGEEVELPFPAGVLLFELGAYQRAVELFEASWRWYGVDSGTAYNLALAHSRLQDRAETVRWLDAALSAEPEHAAARRLRDDLG